MCCQMSPQSWMQDRCWVLRRRWGSGCQFCPIWRLFLRLGVRSRGRSLRPLLWLWPTRVSVQVGRDTTIAIVIKVQRLERDGDGVYVFGSDLLNQRIGRRRVGRVVYDYFRTERGEFQGNCCSDTLGRSCYQSNFSGKREGGHVDLCKGSGRWVWLGRV